MSWDEIATFVFFIIFSALGIWYTCIRKNKKDE